MKQVAAIVLCLLLGPLHARASPEWLTDQVDAGRPADAVTADVAVRVEQVGDHVGAHDTRRDAWVIERGGALSARLRVVPGRASTFEIEEMYGRDTEVRGYLVTVDGKPTYFRTFRGCGAGPVHFFVQLPPTAEDHVTVEIANVHTAPVAISRMWVFSDFSEGAGDAGLDVPFFAAPTIHLTGNYQADLDRLLTIRRSLAADDAMRPAWTTWISYASVDEAATREQIDHALRLAEDSGLPVQLSFDTWWASTPSGSDGQGGFWSDVEYQQVVYNATTKQYHLSVPNRWGSTPWLTVNHPVLNAFKTARLTAATAYLRDQVERRLAEGRPSPVLAVNLDNEPIYWASGNAGLNGDLLLADFNPLAVEAAREAGVRLDPEDGLDREERLWLQRNLLNYNEMIAAAAAEGLGRGTVRVDGEAAQADADPLSSNIYTQAFVADPGLKYPLLDPAQGVWETAAPTHARVGGEYNGGSLVEVEAITHQIALGRSAAVNAEAGDDASVVGAVRPAYALGLRYWAPYNYPLDKLHVAAAQVADLSSPLPPFLYQPTLFEVDFHGEGWRRHVVAQEGVTTGLIGHTAAMAVSPASPSSPGSLMLQVDSPDDEPFTGLTLELSGRAFVPGAKQPEVQIRVLAGAEPDALEMQEIGQVVDDEDINRVHRFDLDDVARDRTRIFVRLELHAPGLDPASLSWCAVRHVRFTTPWPEHLTRGLPPQDDSLATLRAQNLVVSWRRDSELAIAQLAARLEGVEVSWPQGTDQSPPVRLAAARAAHERGLYPEAYRLAMEGICVVLPASFDVSGGGWLRPYPLHVEAAEAMVRCDVLSWDDGVCRFSVEGRGQPRGRALMTLADQRPGAAFSLERASGTWTLRRDDGGGLVADDQGAVRFEIGLEQAVPKPRRSVSGTFRRRSHGGATLVVAPDVAEGLVFVPVNEATVVTLRDAGNDERPAPAVWAALARGDRLDVRLNEDGTAREVRVSRETRVGRVAEFRQLSPYAMAAVTLEQSPAREHVIDLHATMHVAGTTSTVHAQPLNSIDIAAGDVVTLRVDPVTDRAFEVWKHPGE